MTEVAEVSLPEKENSPAEKKTKRNSEPLFGVLLLGAIILFLLLTAAGIGWAVYGGVSKNQAERNEPSITSLGTGAGEEAGEQLSEGSNAAAPVSPSPASPGASSENKTTAVSVLNGGAAGGSAGKLMTALKQEGYTQITAGDATGDYTGVVVYYAESVAGEAETLKTAVAKSYPNVTVAKAIAANKETTASPLTVIIGK